VFQHVVGKDHIEGVVRVGDAAGVGDFAFIQHRVVHDPGIEIEAADAGGMTPEVHLLDDAGSGPKIENDSGGGEMLENALAEQLVVPVAGESGIEGLVEFFDKGGHVVLPAGSWLRRVGSNG
jgi:hypothetical protein